jgi:hypothetical protein
MLLAALRQRELASEGDTEEWTGFLLSEELMNIFNKANRYDHRRAGNPNEEQNFDEPHENEGNQQHNF